MNKTHAIDLRRDIVSVPLANAAIGVAFFVLATVLGAYVRIPVRGSPVPITLQTFFVILAGALLGRRLGLFSQFCYVALGVFGFPVFQGFSGGLSYLFGPTGGYLVGFLFAAYFTGAMLKKDPGASRVFAAFTVGSLIIYAFGFSWLVFLYRISPVHAISAGVLPFVPGDSLKVIAAALVYSKVSRRSKEIFRI